MPSLYGFLATPSLALLVAETYVEHDKKMTPLIFWPHRHFYANVESSPCHTTPPFLLACSAAPSHGLYFADSTTYIALTLHRQREVIIISPFIHCFTTIIDAMLISPSPLHDTAQASRLHGLLGHDRALG